MFSVRNVNIAFSLRSRLLVHQVNASVRSENSYNETAASVWSTLCIKDGEKRKHFDLITSFVFFIILTVLTIF